MRIQDLLRVLEKRKSGGKLFLINFLGNMLILSLNLFLPFFIDDYNYKNFVVVFSLFNALSAIYTFGLQGIITRETTKLKDEKKVITLFFLGWFFLSFFLSIFLVISDLLLNIGRYFELSSNYSWIIILISSSLIGFFRIFLYFLISLSDFKKYNLLFLINKVSQFSLIVFFIFMELDLSFAVFYSSLIVSCLVIWFIKQKYHFKHLLWIESFNLIKKSLPLTLHSFTSLGSGYGYNAIIAAALTPAQTSILNLFFHIQNLGVLINNSLIDSKIKTYYELLNSENKFKLKLFFKEVIQNAIIVVLILLFPLITIFYYSSAKGVYLSFLALLLFLIGLFNNFLKPFGSNLLVIGNWLNHILMISLIYNFINLGVLYILVDIQINNILMVQGVALTIQILLLSYYGFIKFKSYDYSSRI